MKNLLVYILLVSSIFINGCKTANVATESVQNYKYQYEIVPSDPTGTMIYTLDNGLKVY